jgi:hypothetical protein
VQGTSHDVQILGQFLQASIHQQANSVAKRIKTNDMWQNIKKMYTSKTIYNKIPKMFFFF